MSLAAALNEVDSLKREKDDIVSKGKQILDKLTSQKEAAVSQNLELSRENMELQSELADLRRSADQSSELSIWRGKYNALEEECKALRAANETLRVKSSSTAAALTLAVKTRSPLTSPRPTSSPDSGGGKLSEVEAAKLRTQIANLSRENRQLTRANEELSTAARSDEQGDRKRTKLSDPTGSAATAELNEMRKKWASWSSEIVKGEKAHLPPAQLLLRTEPQC